MMRTILFLRTLMAPAQAQTLPGTPMTGAEFDAWATGKTLPHLLL